MAERAIFLYYILCYSLGIMGLLSALFAAASGWGGPGARADLRFAAFTSAFALILIPMTAYVYLETSGMVLDIRVLLLSALSIAGSSAFIVALPLFMGSFLDPPRRLASMPVWIALAGVSFSTMLLLAAAIVLPRTLTAVWSVASYLPFAGMLAAIVETFFSGKRAISRLSALLSASGGPDDPAGDDRLRWLRVLKAMRFMSVFLLLPMLAIDFFPFIIGSVLRGASSAFKIYPAFYAAMNAVYVVECFRLISRRGRRAAIAARRRDGGGTAVPFPPGAAGMEALSPREAEVAALLAAGATYKELCWKLRIKMGTAQSHVSSVYRKLGVNCKEDLMRLARGEGRS